MDELVGEPLRLLCSLPGIEANVISLIQQLSSYISESRDREEHVKRCVDELCAHVSDLRGELSSLRQSAIAHVDQQQQKGEEVKESAASSTNSTRTLTGKSKPRANTSSEKSQSSRQNTRERTLNPVPVALPHPGTQARRCPQWTRKRSTMPCTLTQRVLNSCQSRTPSLCSAPSRTTLGSWSLQDHPRPSALWPMWATSLQIAQRTA